MSSETLPVPADAGVTARRSKTPVGVDVGEKTLVAAATPEMDPADAFALGGSHVRRMFAHLATTLLALEHTGFDTTDGEVQVHAAYYHRLRGGEERRVDFVRDMTIPEESTRIGFVVLPAQLVRGVFIDSITAGP